MTDQRSAMQAPVRPEWLPFPYPASQKPRRNMFAVRPFGPPQSVRSAVALMILRALIAPVSVVVMFQQRDLLRDKILARYPDVAASTATTAVNVALAAAIVAATLWVLCYLYLAVRVRRGGNTARVIAVAVSVLAIVGAFYLAVRMGSAVLQGALLADMAFNVGIVVLLTVTDSWDYANRYRVA